MSEKIELPEIAPPQDINGGEGAGVPEVEEGRQDKQEKEDRHLERESTRLLREKYAGRASFFVWWSLSLWTVTVLLQMFVKFFWNMALFSDTGLGIVTTGVTVNVLGAFIVIAKGLFPK